MKEKLNLTMDNTLLENIKGYTLKPRTSISELIEKLDKPTIDTKADLKELYYQDKAKKYGF